VTSKPCYIVLCQCICESSDRLQGVYTQARSSSLCNRNSSEQELFDQSICHLLRAWLIDVTPVGEANYASKLMRSHAIRCMSNGLIHKYDVSSLRGDYAVVAYYGASVALGLAALGNLKGATLLNRPGTNGGRDLVHLIFTGNYTVNEDGTGVLNLLVTLRSGATATATEDFVITEAEVIHGAPLATKIVNAQRESRASF
jgi:hypothetical protein